MLERLQHRISVYIQLEPTSLAPTRIQISEQATAAHSEATHPPRKKTFRLISRCYCQAISVFLISRVLESSRAFFFFSFFFNCQWLFFNKFNFPDLLITSTLIKDHNHLSAFLIYSSRISHFLKPSSVSGTLIAYTRPHVTLMTFLCSFFLFFSFFPFLFRIESLIPVQTRIM